MLKLTYTVDFDKNQQFEDDHTIPISIKTRAWAMYDGGMSNKRKHKLRIKKTRKIKKRKSVKRKL